METGFKFELGCKVKSAVTGFAGVVVSRAEKLFNVNRYFIQPPVGKYKKIPDAWWVDENELVVTGKRDKNVEVVESGPWTFGLGDKVKSLLNGFSGIIELRAQHINGCLTYYVNGEYNGKESSLVAIWTPGGALEKTGESPLPRSGNKAKSTAKTGGPCNRTC